MGKPAETVPKQMLAARVEEISAPDAAKLGEHDLLIKVAVASYCHTDGMVSEGLFGSPLPIVASHEGAGTVVGVGARVKNFVVGDRVMCGIMVGLCGACADCKDPGGAAQYCEFKTGAIGLQVDGAFAEYMVADSRTSNVLPAGVSLVNAAPLACAGATVWRGISVADLQPGEWLAIVGSGGGLGHLGIQFAKALGLKVIGIDARDEGLELAAKSGADIVVDARKGDDHVVEQVEHVVKERARATLNLSDANTAAATACAATRLHGTMVQIAQPPSVEIPFHELVFRDVRVRGSLITTQSEGDAMLRTVADKKLTVRVNVVRGLAELPKLLEHVHSGKMAGKGIVIVDAAQVDAEGDLPRNTSALY